MNAVDQYTDKLFGIGVDSPTRLPALLDLLRRDYPSNDPLLVWDVVAATYSCCDNTWWHRADLLDLLRTSRVRPLLANKLTFPLSIYRGCSADRVRGISWTTDRSVAEGFARGHRFIPVENPVVAEAVVHREAVFLAVNDRQENEVLVDPRRLRQLKVAPLAMEGTA